MSEATLLRPGQLIKPCVDQRTAKRLVEARYGLRVKSVIELNAYDDKNYRVICPDQSSANPYVSEIRKDGYVLKIVNSLDSRDTGFIEAQTDVLNYLNDRGVKCPLPVRQLDGSSYSLETLGSEGQPKRQHVVRLLVYRSGEVLSKVPESPGTLFEEIGSFAAQLDRLLLGFFHPAMESHTSLWALGAAPKLRDFVFALDDKADKELVEAILASFEDRVLSKLNCLETGVIHGDLNADNIIVNESGDHVEAVIDFGDTHKTCLFFELAICICYMIIHLGRLDVGRDVVKGYERVRPLNGLERKLLKICVCTRFAQTIVIGAYSYRNEPDNHYLIHEQEIKWRMLKELWPLEEDVVADMWRLQAD